MIGQRIKELRLEKNMNQETLAGALHIARSTLAHYETGARDVPNELIPIIARYFDVSTDYLFGLEN